MCLRWKCYEQTTWERAKASKSGRQTQRWNNWLIRIFFLFYAIQLLNAHPCQPTDLPEGVHIVGTCDPPHQKGCRAVCEVNGIVVWRESVTCIHSRKWSSLPPCRALELLRCSKPDDYHQKSSLACVRLHITIPGADLAVKAVCPDILRLFSIFGNCSSVAGTRCAVNCNGFVLLCLVNNKWSPKCSFPVPSLCPDLQFGDLLNCSRIEGISCKVRCPNGQRADEEAVCMPTHEWFPLPDCRYRRLCASQTLPNLVRFLDPTCQNSNLIRCKVGCHVPSNHTRLVSVKDAICMPWGEWRGLPKCKNLTVFLNEGMFKKHQRCAKDVRSRRDKCFRFRGESRCREKSTRVKSRCSLSRSHKRDTRLCPPLPQHFRSSGTCSRTIGSTCTLQCKKGHLEGNNTAFCFLTGEWSVFPLCVNGNDTCPRKLLPFLSFASNCSFTAGAKCQVRCQKDYVLVGLHLIKCENDSWKDEPKCFPASLSPYKALNVRCKLPSHLHGSLKVAGSCNSEGGMSCDIECRDKSARLIGPNATTCLAPGFWTNTESCTGGQPFCPEPKLSKYLETTENCSSKRVGSSCQVRCRARPKMNSYITCVDERGWSAPTKCICAAPILKTGMELVGKCKNKLPSESCSIKCKQGFSMVGKSIITCNDKLKWTPMALCKKIFCVKPDVGKTLLFKEDCSSKSPGGNCTLECKKGGKMLGGNKIQCIDVKHWTKPPNCACPPPLLDETLKTIHNCSEILPGRKCFLTCKDSSLKEGKTYITCQSALVWSRAGKCGIKLCPTPRFSGTLILSEDCSSKGPNERCHLECPGKGKISSPNYIVCLNATHWSTHPHCACPIPILPDFIATKGNCKNIIPGQHCSLTCRRSMKLVGNAFIKCEKNMTWTKEPKCKITHCVKKKLPPHLVYTTDCTDVSPGEKCFVKCKDGGNLKGPHFIACKKGSLWTSLPICLCPDPNLSEDLSPTENCSHKLVGGKCHLKCKNYFTLIGEDFIKCQTNRQWTKLPKCKKVFCSELKLPKALVYKEDCSSKSPGDRCLIGCKEGGKIIGLERVRCVNLKKWTVLPNCTCPYPKLGSELVTAENCSSKLSGQKCSLKCKGDHVGYGKRYIICGYDTLWSSLPTCKVVHCQPPKLPVVLSPVSDCSSVSPSESCFLKCHEGGKLIGSNKIICINRTRWSPFPTCTCAVPHLPEDLSTTEPCDRKMVGEKCHVRCKSPLLLVGNHFIKCQKNTRWSRTSKCKTSVCPEPRVLNYMDLLENCSLKKVGEKCKLKCKEEETALRSMHISCIKVNGVLSWTQPPHCKCSKPVLSGGLHAREDCSRKMPGDACKVVCAKNLTLIGRDFLSCENDTNWSALPKCS